jgi:hypothetical protein
MKLVRENINEKFKEESDPIRDMAIGTVSLHEIAKKTIGNKKLRNGKNQWRNYLHSLIGKKITGKFYIAYDDKTTRKLKEYTFIIKSCHSYFDGTEIMIVGDDGIQYVTNKNERYVIR